MSIPVRRRHIYQAKIHNKFIAMSCITVNYTVSRIHEPLSAVEMQQQLRDASRLLLNTDYIMVGHHHSTAGMAARQNGRTSAI